MDAVIHDRDEEGQSDHLRTDANYVKILVESW